LVGNNQGHRPACSNYQKGDLAMTRLRQRIQRKLNRVCAVIGIGILLAPMCVQAGTVKWKFNNILPEARPETGVIMKFSELVKEKTEGRVEIKVFSGGSLGVKPEETLRWLPKGFPETALIYTNFLGRDAPQLANIYPAGIAGSAEENENAAIITEKIIVDTLQKSGIETMGTLRSPDFKMSIFCRKDPVSSLKDLRKKKLRVYSKHLVDTFKRLGVSALIIPQTELYVAIKTGVCDCALYPDFILPTISLQEVVKYRSTLYLDGKPSWIMGVSAKKWKTLSEEDQQIIKDVGLSVQSILKDQTPALEAAAIEKLVDSGVVMLDDFSEEDRQAFFDAASETWEETCTDISPEALQNREKIMKAIGR
jgi:TRAP-type C4-dicarboxylate transport system substrate-binding protein